MHDRNTTSAQKRQSHCVVYEIENNEFFHCFCREKTPENKGGLADFWLSKCIVPIPTMGKM